MVKTHARPGSVGELVGVLSESSSVRILASPASEAFRVPSMTIDAVSLDLSALDGVLEFSPDDQVVVVRAGTTLRSLQTELAKYGHCLPRIPWGSALQALNAEEEILANLVGLNLPHSLETECGSWRDWILGATVVRADGSSAKCGSKAVKNVAGYDFHRFLVGARGTLAVPVEFIFRTFPIRSLPNPRLAFYSADAGQADCAWIQRTMATDFEAASIGTRDRRGVDIPESSTFVRFLPAGADLPRFENDWVLRSGSGPLNLQFVDPTTVRLMKRAKANFDPQGKLNPGEMGIF